MAGTFTHWMIVEEALDKFNRLPDKHPYSPIILGNSHFVTLGAVGPDSKLLEDFSCTLTKVDIRFWDKAGTYPCTFEENWEVHCR